MSRSNQHPATHKFLQQERQLWIDVVADMTTDEKVHIMPLENLRSYFTANDSREMSKILSEVFTSKYPPVDPDLILRDHSAIFCILLRIGQGIQIEHFVRYEELSDRRLPFDSHQPPTAFPVVGDDPAFLQRFCQMQWMYCVPIFDGHMLHKHFGPQRLLPITHMESQGSEGMADKYVIKLHGSHNRLLPAGHDMKPDNPSLNTFVLKRYPTKVGESYYTQEVNGFRSVRHADSIIKFYGSYIHGDASNVLLEFADKGSLEDYFQTETPPSRGVDIIKFWDGLFQLIKGVKAVHSVRNGHFDIKPENVLVLSNGANSPSEWQFKFADFGMNSSRSRREDNGQEMAIEMRHTSTYGAPECYLPYNVDDELEGNSNKITWAADIWSLGCIYSEAAIWIADGYKGLVDYRRQRKTETDRILFRGGDCFHDGERLLQLVIHAHGEIEDRLRRSDYITKDVLDSMVDEMLWEEDRPNAKALLRKAEVVLSRARQRLSAVSVDEFPRPASSQGRSLPPLRHQPPTQPLPPIPRDTPRQLSSISERQYRPSVENWRSQITVPQNGGSQFGGSQFGGPGSDVASPTSHSRHFSSNDSASDLDREITGSIASWQLGDDQSIASPSTAFTSPSGSVQFDYNKHNPNQGRPRALQSRTNNELRRPPMPMLNKNSYASQKNVPLTGSRVSMLPEVHGSLRQRDLDLALDDSEWNVGPSVPEPRVTSETKPLGRTLSLASRVSSRHSSSAYSIPTSQSAKSEKISHVPSELAIPPKSQKRSMGFSLFPTKSHKIPPVAPLVYRVENEKVAHDYDDAPRSVLSPSDKTGPTTAPSQTSQSADYLSLEACLEWKRVNKGAKKSAKLPLLPGAKKLERLNERDHVFIIDDSASMSALWPNVQRVFEALSYLVKGMSTDGTELFFTVSYDTYLRKNPADLCKFLETKAVAGVTNISYRLNLQLQSYRAKIYASRGLKGKKGIVRPVSFYILTNGQWGKGSDPKILIKETADFLLAEDMTSGQVTIEFINFAQGEDAVQKIDNLAKSEFAVDIADSTPWTGNLLEMLCGPLDKST